MSEEEEPIEVVLLRDITADGTANRGRIIHLRESGGKKELGLVTGRGFVVVKNDAEEGIDYAAVPQ